MVDTIPVALDHDLFGHSVDVLSKTGTTEAFCRKHTG